MNDAVKWERQTEERGTVALPRTLNGGYGGVGTGWVALPRTLGSGYGGVGTGTVAMPRTQSGGYGGVGKDSAVERRKGRRRCWMKRPSAAPRDATRRTIGRTDEGNQLRR